MNSKSESETLDTIVVNRKDDHFKLELVEQILTLPTFSPSLVFYSQASETSVHITTSGLVTKLTDGGAHIVYCASVYAPNSMPEERYVCMVAEVIGKFSFELLNQIVVPSADGHLAPEIHINDEKPEIINGLYKYDAMVIFNIDPKILPVVKDSLEWQLSKLDGNFPE